MLPSLRTTRLHPVVVALTALALVALCAPGCAFFKKKNRRFGSTCGQASECESGLCYNGFCSITCQNAKQCGSGVCVENVCQSPDLDFDNDSLTNAYEVANGLDPTSSDTDKDDISDGSEIGPNLAAPKDSNFDGIADAVQSNKTDADGDCIVDAFDTKKAAPDPLPNAANFCNKGVCKGNLNQVTLACDPTKVTGKAVDGCIGCVCQAPNVPNWQATETWCDALDNDCDAKTDEDLKLGDIGLGFPCQAANGVCAVAKKAGVVQCGPAKLPQCSSDGGGTAAAGTPEVCNAIDDDCDGQTDEDFALFGAKVGQPCASCPGSGLKCPSGAPFNPPIVVCGNNGQSAVCGAAPFATKFEKVIGGGPEPRQLWTTAWSEKDQKVHVYGGAVAAAVGTVPRAEQWTLQIDDPTAKALWAIHPADAGAQTEAALAADPNSTAVYLIGGTLKGAPIQTIWRADAPGDWKLVSGAAVGATLADLPNPTATPNKQAPAHAAVLKFNATKVLVVLSRHYPQPLWHPLDGQPATWAEPAGEPTLTTADVQCVAPTVDGAGLVVAFADGGWVHLNWTGLALEATAIVAQGDVQAYALGQCVFDGDGLLHLFGGQLDGTTSSERRTAVVALDPPAAATFTLATDGADLTAVIQRSNALAAWSKKLNALVVAGGFRTTVGKRADFGNAFAYKPAISAQLRLDRPVPRARFGHAMGWWPQQKALCIAGGLTPEVPIFSAKPRSRAADDAWCLGPAEIWVPKLPSGVKFAFGAYALDGPTQRLVLHGGLALSGDGEVADVALMWNTNGGVKDANSAQGKVRPQFEPTNAVRAVELGAALDQPAKMTPLKVDKAPYLGAPSFVHDELRRRIVLYGGWGKLKESTEFGALDLDLLQWTDLHSLNQACSPGNGPHTPPPRYGGIAVYHEPLDVFAVTGGFLYAAANGVVGIDTSGVFDPKDPTSYIKYPCVNDNGYSHFWATRTLHSQAFCALQYPFYTDVSAPTKASALLHPYVGGPLFAPLLFDAAGNHGWIAVNAAPQPADPKCPELGPTVVNPLDLSRYLTVDGAQCVAGGPVSFRFNPQVIDPVPEALFASAAKFFAGNRQGWITGGLHPDGTASIEAHRLDQQCKGP